MNKKLLMSKEEYLQFAFDTIREHELDKYVMEQFGTYPRLETYTWDKDGNEIDENGNFYPPETPETMKVEDWVNELSFPLIYVYSFANSFDRVGNVTMYITEIVSLSEFKL